MLRLNLLFALLSLTITCAGTTVTLSSDARLLVDGNPHFSLALSPGPPIDIKTPEGADGWAEFAEGGIDLVRGGPWALDWSTTWTDHLEKYMDVAYKHGVYVFPNLRELAEPKDAETSARLAAFVNRFKNHPALFMWKGIDEPFLRKIGPEIVKTGYDVVRALDPNHPIWIVHSPHGTVAQLLPYTTGADILGTDVYPVRKRWDRPDWPVQLSRVGDLCTRTVALAGGKKAVTMTLQVCASGNLAANQITNKPTPWNKLVFPTYREERYMAYQSIICGANGLVFFGMPFGLAGTSDEQYGYNWSYWRAVLKPLFAEFKKGSELYPVLIAPDTKYQLQFTGAPQIEARWRELGPYLYIFAAAREGGKIEVKFSGVEDGEVPVLFENRTLTAEGGAFTDIFKQYDVHVYRALRALVRPPNYVQAPSGQ